MNCSINKIGVTPPTWIKSKHEVEDAAMRIQKWKTKQRSQDHSSFFQKFRSQHPSRSHPLGAHCSVACLKGHSRQEARPASSGSPGLSHPTALNSRVLCWVLCSLPSGQAGHRTEICFAAWSPYGCFSLDQMRSARAKLLTHPGSRNKEKTGGSLCAGENRVTIHTRCIYIHTYR